MAWAAVALADKADTLAGLFVAGERPTGSRDPYGLRRAAQGLVRLLADLPELTGIERIIGIEPITERAFDAFAGHQGAPDAGPALEAFMRERVASVFEQRGADIRNIRAVMGSGQLLTPLTVRRRLAALPEFTETSEFQQLAQLFKRVRNIARQLPDDRFLEAEDAGTPLAPLSEPAELALADEIEARRPIIDAAVRAGDGYRRAFVEAAAFAPAVPLLRRRHGHGRRPRRARGPPAAAATPRSPDPPTRGRLRDGSAIRLVRSACLMAKRPVSRNTKKAPARSRVKAAGRPAKAKAKKAVRKAAPKTSRRSTVRTLVTAAVRAARSVVGRGGSKYVYFFGDGKAEGHRGMKDVLGGKGSGLAEMTNAGLPVPPGFTISTAACNLYYANHGKLTPAIEAEIDAKLKQLEKSAKATLGSATQPLLVSVRSGAKFSMPGMMDTILNLGLNDETVEGVKAWTKNGRFAFDSYRRFIQMFGSVVLEIPKAAFEHEFESVKAAVGAKVDTDLDEAALRDVVARYKAVVKAQSGKAFPQDPHAQLRMARNAVFRSWNNPRAREYRRIYDIPDSIGTAVNVQMMVFGNTGDRSATGVGFTRNPATGAREFYGEFLVNAQGEDVVAGIRTPRPINELAEVMPRAYQQLRQITTRLEKHYKDIQDFEFTIQDDRLFMLQTRSGKRTGYAAVVIATDLMKERLVTPTEALLLVDPEALSQLLAPGFDPKEWKQIPVATRGLPASPGAACGQVVFTSDHAVEWTSQGKSVILVRRETVPDDIHGMWVSQGILTATGGMTSHAAVVGRQMGKPSIVGAGELTIDEHGRTFTLKGQTIKEGDWVAFDGLTGEVKLARVSSHPSEILQVLDGTLQPGESDIYQRFEKLLAQADKVRRLGVRANADQPDQAEIAYKFGARGIGLCRTEHMFFGEGRIPIVQRMILADNEADRRAALAELLPMQREDFYGVFKAMRGTPVTIRTIDPPLHEFLPKREELMVEIAVMEATGKGGADALAEKKRLLARVEQLHEFNPMLGHRGVRLGITYPEITEMQARAILEAAARCNKEGLKVVPEIMIPLVGLVKELQDQKAVVDRVAAEVMKEQGLTFKYLVGTMIEVPRGALTADQIAREAQFFSFGTNDLTQMTFGFSRDDVGKFLRVYQDRKMLDKDPFATFDAAGTGQLVAMAVQKGRAVRPDLKLGICGEHGGDPASIHFFNGVGLDYVSASPYRIPVARLAAAQAALQVKVGD
ncbi:MAG: pyruvate, phosphate dikinase [Vicinamibacterales bacterium]